MADAGGTVTDDEAVALLDLLNGGDPEAEHGEADRILLSLVSERVREAVQRAQDRSRSGWWWA